MNIPKQYPLYTYLVFLLMSILVPVSYAIENTPKGERIQEQSFKTNFKHFKNVMFSSYNDFESGPGKVHFYLFRNNKIVYEFPEFPVDSGSWSFENVKAISFKDINNDGLKDVIVIAEYITGIGPNGMIPFLVKGVYLQRKGKFVSAEKISKLLSSEKNYSSLKTISSIVKYLKTLDAKTLNMDVK